MIWWKKLRGVIWEIMLFRLSKVLDHHQLSAEVRIRIYKTVILLVVLYEYETWLVSHVTMRICFGRLSIKRLEDYYF